MARNKSRGSQMNEMITGFIGLVLLGSMAGTYILTKSIEISIIVGGLVFSFLTSLLIIRKLNSQKRIKNSGIADIDKMEGIEFEHYLGHLFRAQGYKAEVTKAAGDYGADLIIQKDSKKIVVQAKRYSKNVGIKAVQEAQASIAHYGAVEAWVVSNSDYTVAAYELAKSNVVKLINREGLIQMILSIEAGEGLLSKAVVVEEKNIVVDGVDTTMLNPIADIAGIPIVDEIICPKCNSKLVLRNGPRGQFYGCTSFPKCRHTKRLEVS
ncbi:restriction endonuclease [Paenibacillus sp. CMAA1364]